MAQVPQDILQQIMMARAERDTKTIMVLLDSMLHACEKLHVPTNIQFMVIDSYVIALRKKLTKDFGAELVADLEKGASDAADMWWGWKDEKKQVPPPPPTDLPPPPPAPASETPKKKRDDGPDYIA